MLDLALLHFLSLKSQLLDKCTFKSNSIVEIRTAACFLTIHITFIARRCSTSSWHYSNSFPWSHKTRVTRSGGTSPHVFWPSTSHLLLEDVRLHITSFLLVVIARRESRHHRLTHVSCFNEIYRIGSCFLTSINASIIAARCGVVLPQPAVPKMLKTLVASDGKGTGQCPQPASQEGNSDKDKAQGGPMGPSLRRMIRGVKTVYFR
jgi:hypothetical protein